MFQLQGCNTHRMQKLSSAPCSKEFPARSSSLTVCPSPVLYLWILARVTENFRWGTILHAYIPTLILHFHCFYQPGSTMQALGNYRSCSSSQLIRKGLKHPKNQFGIHYGKKNQVLWRKAAASKDHVTLKKPCFSLLTASAATVDWI